MEATPGAPTRESDARDQARKMYASLGDYEHHFNKMELEIRKLASVWMLAVFGGIAFVVRGDVGEESLVNVGVLIPLLASLGSVGLFVLWIQDYVVYHGLLRAVFIMGLRLEYQMEELPPLRSIMMRLSGGGGMARFMKLYYIIPQVVLSIIAIAAAWNAGWEPVGIVIGAVAVVFTTATIVLSTHVHADYVEYAKEFEYAAPERVEGEFARMMDASDKAVTFGRTVGRWQRATFQRASASVAAPDAEGGAS